MSVLKHFEEIRTNFAKYLDYIKDMEPHDYHKQMFCDWPAANPKPDFSDTFLAGKSIYSHARPERPYPEHTTPGVYSKGLARLLVEELLEKYELKFDAKAETAWVPIQWCREKQLQTTFVTHWKTEGDEAICTGHTLILNRYQNLRYAYQPGPYDRRKYR